MDSMRSGLQEEWRTLCMVFALVTAKNRGKPKLAKDLVTTDPRLERNRRQLDQRLFDLVPLFPRNTEIIASALLKPTPKAPQISVVSLVEDITDSQQPIFVGCAASIANPDTRRIKRDRSHGKKTEEKLVEKTKIRLASEGTSSWNQIKMSTSDAIVRMESPKHGELANYIATLSDFFHGHQVEKDPTMRSILFYRCLRYVTVSCWRKMYRRMDHWISMGYIYQIAVIPPASIVDMAEAKPNAADGKPRSDVNLYRLLDQLAPGVIKGIMSQFCPSPDQQLDNIGSLMAALELKHKSGDWSSSVYDRDVCLEFHHLLIALLLGYGRSLFRLHEFEVDEGKLKEKATQQAAAQRKDDKRVAKGDKVKQGKYEKKGKKTKTKTAAETEETAAETEETAAAEKEESQEIKEKATRLDNVCTYSRVLWTVICSRLFHDHSRVVEALFKRPTRKAADDYKKWANFGGAVARGEEAELEGHVNRAEEKDDNNAGSSGVDEAGNWDDHYGVSDEMDDDENDQAEDIEEEVEGHAEHTLEEGPSDFDMFKAWVKLNTSHFTALQKASKHNMSRIDFPVIELVPPQIPLLDWHKFLRNYMERRNEPKSQVEKVIGRLQTIIDSNAYDICRLFGVDPKNLAKNSAKKRTRNLDLKVGQVRSNANRHAESDLASGQRYPFPNDWPISEPARALLESLDTSSIAVSRLCCPICSEFLKVVRGESLHTFLVRGDHPCFYPVDMPDWIPLEVMQKMLETFGDLLYVEITLVMDPETKHKKSDSNASMQSFMSSSSVTSIANVSPA